MVDVNVLEKKSQELKAAAKSAEDSRKELQILLEAFAIDEMMSRLD